MSFDDMIDHVGSDPELMEKPFFKIAKGNKEDLKNWLVGVASALVEEGQDRTRIQQDNMRMYRGVSKQRRDRFRDRDRSQRRLSKVQKFVVNHLYDLTETKISQMTRIKPAVEVLPNNDEWKDRASAKVVGMIQKNLWEQDDIDGLRMDMHRQSKIFGESFMFITWNDDKGDLHPAYVAARDAGMPVNTAELKAIKMTGDVDHQVELPWRVYLQRKDKIKDCEYVMRMKIVCTEELRADYPGKTFEDDEDFHIFDTKDLAERRMEQQTLVWEFFHVDSKRVDGGYYAKFTKDHLLETSELPYNHGQLPFVRLTDLDVPGVLNGVSRYETVGNLQGMYNNLSTLIAKNFYLTGHTKVVMPRGACKIDQMGNDNTILQYQGPIAPAYLAPPVISPQMFDFRREIKQEMQTVYGSHGISRGQVPKGITAASALQFLNELESERATTDIAKDSKLIKNIAKMGIAVAGDNYDPEDGRMLRIVGENNKFLIRAFDTAHLHKSYDIRFDTSTGLPETKSAKIQRALDALQRAPQMLSPERWSAILDLGDTEKLITMTTEAVRASDSIVEDILAGREVRPLEEWNDLAIHWETYTKAMQSRSFNEDVPQDIRDRMKDFLYWTEEMMIDKGQKNPEFEARLATLQMFPIFVHDDFVIPRSREQQLAVVQGETNRGDNVTGNIPGTGIEEIQKEQHAQKQLKGS